jgi:heme/copper-type cytochrome/quinol oxidase subunit 3
MQNVIAIPNASRRRAPLSDGVLGMLIFVMAEAMLFAGLISAFTISKAAAFTAWPPPGQPRLPILATAFNSAVLLASAGTMLWAARAFQRDRASARLPLLLTCALGAFFVVFQGLEWVALLREGLTLTSSQHGSFFYLIVGLHGVHAVGALLFLLVLLPLLQRGQLGESRFGAAQVLWYFVVGLWPLLYARVYL